MPCVNKRSHVLKHTNTQTKGDTNSQVKAAGLFKCVWPFLPHPWKS